MERRTFLKNAFIVGCTAAVGGMLTGHARQTGDFLRPPGALEEPDFLATCIRCGRCADACPNRCIAALTDQTGRDFSVQPGPAEAGTPAIFPRKQGCMLCSGVPGSHLKCTEACPSGALQKVAKDADAILNGVSMGTAEIDERLCYSYNGATCGVCGRACPYAGKALKIGLYERPSVNAEYCVGCGLCERSCIYYPQAIRVKPRHKMVADGEGTNFMAALRRLVDLST